MEHRTWTTIDRVGWAPGPWDAEPDKEQWPDEATGLPCLIKRNGSGALCGYVGVAEGHPWFGIGYGDVEPWPYVHGGLTYSDFCMDGDEARTICHVPGPGEPDRLWWLGFDCAHGGDLCPAYPGHLVFPGDVYRPVAYVKAQCAGLAEQAAKAGAS